MDRIDYRMLEALAETAVGSDDKEARLAAVRGLATHIHDMQEAIRDFQQQVDGLAAYHN